MILKLPIEFPIGLFKVVIVERIHAAINEVGLGSSHKVPGPGDEMKGLGLSPPM
jgi:hypothetical protein